MVYISATAGGDPGRGNRRLSITGAANTTERMIDVLVYGT